ncbi:hypothetical protein B0A75_15965 [Flavobacterium oncorhynchi]|uniref:Glycosyltransferase 2-like domain-containing protein n=1 Tax=Flavobacterium oncorhynchi TaxID=728056 RepID=A0A226HT46_9FLAO|nr:glycosyltransferase family A protein [Flavobacterium oncorhynchi]OXA97457.1 hypothetical protein B0A75_15965 [Flavobacterium oncorhynchi]
MSVLLEESFVSVIIPTYNNYQTIIFALKSVFEQSFKNFEIIIINDGSTDDTDLRIRQYIDTITDEDKQKIVYLIKENSGPSDSRNLGIRKAKGNFIAFLDADDCWSKDKLRLQLTYFENFPNAILVAGAFDNKKFNDVVEYKVILFRMLLFKNFFSTPTIMVRSNFLQGIKFNSNQRYSEDYRLWLEISLKGDCIFINEILARNQNNKNSFGDSGLSANLWQMTKGEMSNYIYFCKKKKISLLTFMAVSSYSFVKYIRRVLLTYFKKIDFC